MLYTFLIAVLAVVLDQISKVLVKANLEAVGDSFTLIDGILDFRRINNNGMAFGAFDDKRWVFMVFSVIAIGAIVFYIVKEKPESMVVRTCLGAVLGGGIGNMIDRIAFGTVTDFIDCTFSDFFFFGTVFNVADIFVTVGCVTLIFYMLIVEIPKETKKSKAAKPTESEENINE